MTSISWVICCMERSNLSQPMPATKGAPQREELAEVDVDWLIAERPGKVRTLKQHPRKNKTAINIEYMKASIRARWSTVIPHFWSTQSRGHAACAKRCFGV